MPPLSRVIYLLETLTAMARTPLPPRQGTRSPAPPTTAWRRAPPRAAQPCRESQFTRSASCMDAPDPPSSPDSTTQSPTESTCCRCRSELQRGCSISTRTRLPSERFMRWRRGLPWCAPPATMGPPLPPSRMLLHGFSRLQRRPSIGTSSRISFRGTTSQLKSVESSNYILLL